MVRKPNLFDFNLFQLTETCLCLSILLIPDEHVQLKTTHVITFYKYQLGQSGSVCSDFLYLC